MYFSNQVFHWMFLTGIDPSSLRGSKTGVFIGLGDTQSWESYSTNPEQPNPNSFLGCSANMMANKISEVFDFKGW